MQKKLSITIAALIALSIILSACASGNTPSAAPTTGAQPAATEPAASQENAAPTENAAQPAQAADPSSASLPEVDPASLQGDIVAAGSSTVYPLAEAIADNFRADGFAGEIKLDSVGTGGGFERFCKTMETDVANASRAIKDSELEQCRANGREPIPFLVGLDAIAIVVNSQNDFLTNVTLDELSKIFTKDAVNWSDVNPAWPNEPIQRFTPGTDSGTFDFFVETVVQKPQGLATLDEAKPLVLDAQNLQTSEDDNVLVAGVEGSPYAIGYFGYAYYQNNASHLKLVSIDGVEPSLDSAESGEYALARPLYLYSDAKILQDKPQVAAYINYFLTNVGDVIEEVGYFPASAQAMAEARTNWLDAAAQ
ncbi:MAG TPA: PstS family phosphate ABC transporter substrate-binding protein [Anaerolineaceae bacterium]|nr:PstS family phosphate ABC transporter substrate-binding protein [Anaerolineaceae bacterium]